MDEVFVGGVARVVDLEVLGIGKERSIDGHTPGKRSGIPAALVGGGRLRVDTFSGDPLRRGVGKEISAVTGRSGICIRLAAITYNSGACGGRAAVTAVPFDAVPAAAGAAGASSSIKYAAISSTVAVSTGVIPAGAFDPNPRYTGARKSASEVAAIGLCADALDACGEGAASVNANRRIACAFDTDLGVGIAPDPGGNMGNAADRSRLAENAGFVRDAGSGRTNHAAAGGTGSLDAGVRGAGAIEGNPAG